MLKIGNLQLKNNVILAPMAGWTDLSFRLLVKKISGCGMVCSEMVSSEGLVRRNKKTFKLLKTDVAEKPVSFQIFGSRAEVMAEAAVILEEMGADVVDLNFGCPEPKIVRSNSGSALLKDTKLLFTIVRKVRNKIKIPLTIKIRSGWDEKNINAIDIAVECQNLGVDAIIIHPRTRSQFFQGHSNWQIIGEVKSRVKIPVIGNGDIMTVEDVSEMIKKTKCDGVMIGRGALSRPWLLKEIIHYLETGEILPLLSVEERLSIILEHLKLYTDLKIEMPYIRKYISFYLKGMVHAKLWRKELMNIKFLDDFKKFVEQIRIEAVS